MFMLNYLLDIGIDEDGIFRIASYISLIEDLMILIISLCTIICLKEQKS